VARSAHYIVPTGGTVPIQTLLLEPQRTNLCIRSEEFDTWTSAGASGTTVTANAIAAPDGTTTADLLTAGSTTARRERSVTFTGDGEKCVAVYLKAGTSARSSLAIHDTTASVNRVVIRVDWAGTLPSVAVSAGTGTVYPTEALANGWYRVLFSAAGVVAAQSNVIRVFPDALNGTGTVYAWGAQAENAVVPSSYIKTEATTVTRSADSLYFPFTAPPQAMTAYVRGIERDRANAAAPADQGVLYIGDGTSGNDPRFVVRKSTAGAGYVAEHDNGITPTATAAVGSAPRGSLSELRAVLSDTGAVTLGVSVNAGGEVTNGPSTAQSLLGAWAGQRLYLNSEADGTPGMFAYTHVCVAAGEQSLATMRQLAGVV
jgi:hypothetical protein